MSEDFSGRVMTRRELLILSTLGIASVTGVPFLVGCGGGGGGNGGQTPSLLPRTEPSGTLNNQINQYSLSLDQLSTIWKASSPGLNSLTALLASSRAVTRAETSGSVALQLTYIGLIGLRGIYEMQVRQTLELDNVGYLAQRITQGNGFTGQTALDNPQWVAAMMERNYTGIAWMGLTMEILQTVGLRAFIATVREQTDPNRQLIAYGMLGEVFNDWVQHLCQYVNQAVDPTWQLDMGETTAVTTARVLEELDRIPDILSDLPFGPGYNASPTLPPTRQEPAPKILDPTKVIPSIVAEIAEKLKEVIEKPKELPEILQKMDQLKDFYPERLEINTSKLAKFVLKNLGKEFTKDIVKAIAKEVITIWYGKLAGEQADCIFEILSGSIELAKLFSLTVATLEVPPLAILAATLAALKIIELLTKIEECLCKLRQDVDEVRIKQRSGPLRGRISKDDFIPFVRIPVRTIPTVNSPRNAEVDQLSRNRVLKGGVSMQRRPRKTPKPPVELKAVALKLGDVPNSTRQTLTGTASSQSTSASVSANGETLGQYSDPGRSLSRQQSVSAVIIRTYAGVEMAALLLLRDYATRNPNTVEGEEVEEGFTLFMTDLALLVRREAGSTAVQVPAITDAQLLCTSPGFLPMRSYGVEDLTTLLGMPELQPATELSPGGNINVR